MARFSEDRLQQIYDKTSGRCAGCDKKLARINYGVSGARGEWQVDHSKPQSKGGTDHLNNLQPMCPACNRAKSDEY